MDSDSLIANCVRSNWVLLAVWVLVLGGAFAASFRDHSPSPRLKSAPARRRRPTD